MPGPLDGIRVIDLTQGLCGPFATLRLGDAGADVVKLEPPNGDAARRMGPPFLGDESALFLALNRNKRSVVVDLESGPVARHSRDSSPARTCWSRTWVRSGWPSSGSTPREPAPHIPSS